MSKLVRVVQYGLGPIGQASARVLLEKQKTGCVQLVGAIDIDPDKVGKDLADLLDLEEKTGIIVSDDAAAVLHESNADVAVHTTSSFLDRVQEQLLLCAKAGVHVVSSTEELAFPFARHPERATALDMVARQHGVVFLGTGVNPGFAMDTLVLTATGVCTDVSRIEATRVVNAGLRRGPLQKKVGAGITPEAFAERKATGTFGHIGLRESLLLVGEGLNWSFDRIEETLDPVISDKDVETPHVQVATGQVAGIHQAITGYRHDTPLVTLDLKMYAGADNPHDRVHIDGTPPIDMVIQGGIFGDTATIAALVNAVPLVLNSTPGLRTMKDMRIPRAFATSPMFNLP